MPYVLERAADCEGSNASIDMFIGRPGNQNRIPMANQKFIEIAQKLRRLERMMGGLAKDAEEKALLFDWRDNVERGKSGHPTNRTHAKADETFDRSTLGRLLLNLRDCRHEHLEPELFSNISWDILLTLFVDGDGGKKGLTTKAVCLSSKVAPATGSRWLALLEEEGLIRRYPSKADQRASMVELSSAGALMMEQYIDSAGSAIYALFVDMQIETAVEKPPVS
ncbi:MarR family transcriptional regulator [Croceicoccus bisphenolivorans]|uniref:MarR family transcriptional regulator n=1 Tax=Croceicoccus bisphenolivorans TaxID=1783232 RepID=UPI00082A4F1A|nr:MarR family transcriptional regulator [Croceicoccus bisphenolivorans]